jgi:hypothetical protein
MGALGEAAARTRELARAIKAAVAIAALAISALIHSHGSAVAQSLHSAPSSAPAALTVPLSIPMNSGDLGQFAFGHVEFDWNPRGGVPGFDSWPPASRP